jgi:outer membrane protein
MKAFMVAAALTLVLGTSPAFAQAQAPAQAQKPATPPAATAPAPQPAPFPAGQKFAFIDVQRIGSESAEGKASNAKLNSLGQQKEAEIGEKTKQLQADQTKLQQSGSVMTEDARSQLQAEIERLGKDIERQKDDARTELQQRAEALRREFERKLVPIIQQVTAEKGILMLFSRADAGIVWADDSLDLTVEVIRRFDAATTAAAPKPPVK